MLAGLNAGKHADQWIREGFPKQFRCLTGDESLFQLAAKRLAALGADDVQVNKPLIVSNEEHRFLASEQLRESGIELGVALLEPADRNTAPAVPLVALAALQDGSDPVLVVTPSNQTQTIADQPAFIEAIQLAIREAATGGIVILGIPLDHPETGYGYIKVQGTEVSNQDQPLALVVDSFIEKPNAPTAQTYLDPGNYYWNAGMLVLKASAWLKAFKTFRPDIATVTEAAREAKSQDSEFVRPGKELFGAIPSESVACLTIEYVRAVNFRSRWCG